MDEQENELILAMGSHLDGVPEATAMHAISTLFVLYFIFASRPRMNLEEALFFLDRFMVDMREVVQERYNEETEDVDITWRVKE